VKFIDPHSEADGVGLLAAFLTMFGSMVGRTARFWADGTKHFPNLFACLVGSTSSGKGAACSQAERFMKLVDPDWQCRTGLVSHEGILWHVRDPRVKTGPKGEKELDPGVEDKRLLVFEPEMGKVFKCMLRQGNTLEQGIMDCWDGRHKMETLRTNNQAVTATDAHVSMIGNCTPTDLGKYLTESYQANGWANRWLWVKVQLSKLRPFSSEPDEYEENALALAVREALAFAQDQEKMVFDEPARDVWQQEYAGLKAHGESLTAALLARGAPQVRRLAMIYALLDRSAWIGEVHLRAALALWEHCKKSVESIFTGASGNGPVDALAAKIEAALAKVGKWLTQTKLWGEIGHYHKKAVMEQALEKLMTEGRVERKVQSAPGGPHGKVQIILWRVAKKKQAGNAGIPGNATGSDS
jgi:hypothetical protein